MTDFLQSETWARFQERVGREVVRLPDGGFGFTHSLSLAGKYLYTPRWPGSSDKGQATRDKEIENLLATASERGMGWVRIEPESETTVEELRAGYGKRLVKAPHDMQPRQTFVASVALPDDELLAAMKPKTRYNVRLAEKKGVQVFETNEERYRNAFVDLVFETAARQGIEPHPRRYYELQLESLAEAGHIFVAGHEGDVLAVAYVVYHNDTAIYLHGGSAEAKKNLMASYLLHFRAMQAAREAGLRHYDFGGVQASDKEKVTSEKGNGDKNTMTRDKEGATDPWSGITRFKLGFSEGTAPREYPGSYDIVLDAKRYGIYQLGSAFRASIAHIRKKLK